VLGRADLVVLAPTVRAAHLDRAAPGDRARRYDQAGPRVVVRAGRDADAAVARVATGLGVALCAIMRQVLDRGTPQVDDPDRLAGVNAVGVDETAYLHASPCRVDDIRDRNRRSDHGPVGALLDMVEGRSGTMLATWLAEREQAWRAGITTASLDPAHIRLTML
jgi:transposase